MTQNGVVVHLLSDGMAEVMVQRGTACGGSCGSCEACEFASRLTIRAENAVHAAPGDRVILSSPSRGILGAAMLVYMLPLGAFLTGCALAAVLGAAQGWIIAAGGMGLALGVGISVWLGRRRREVRFVISAYQRA